MEDAFTFLEVLVFSFQGRNFLQKGRGVSSVLGDTVHLEKKKKGEVSFQNMGERLGVVSKLGMKNSQ